jgi:hypothetical protein
MKRRLHAVAAVIFAGLFVRTCAAQGTRRHEFSFVGGISPTSGGPIGTTPDRQLFTISVSYGLVVLKGSSAVLKYDASVLPIVLVHGQRSRSAFGVERAQTTYGAGLEPVGFQTNFRPRQMVQPFVSTAGGILYFHEPVPVSRASQLNFTFSFGGGIELFIHPTRSLLIGYKFHHLSNAYTAALNPGIDSHIIFVGVSFKRQRLLP